MIATNVAARGLDFDDTRYVFQLELPKTIDSYTRRIGRTGRIGNEGTAIAYLGPANRRIAEKLKGLLTMNMQEVPLFLEQLANLTQAAQKVVGKRKF